MGHELPKKSLGQHWLHDTTTLAAICDAAEVKSDDVVLEIGPGLGTLTNQLLKRGAKVRAIEYDSSLINPLKDRFKEYTATKLRVEEADIRTYDLGNLPHDYKITANIPYYLTAYLFRILSDIPNKPSVAALLVQKEVAERVAARPGEMSLLSVSVQLYYQVGLGPVVPAKLFTPPPKVDSQILMLVRHPKPLFHDIDIKLFFRLVKAGFSNRRKTLLNALSAGFLMDKNQAREVLEQAGLNPHSRAQELSLLDWHKLYLRLK